MNQEPKLKIMISSPTYINSYSWKCLLGPQSKNFHVENEIYFWEVGSRRNFCVARGLSLEDLPKISGHRFHYLSIDNLKFLREFSNFEVSKTKNTSTYIQLTNPIQISGKENKDLRYALNRAKKIPNLNIESQLRNLQDIKDMIEEWSNVLAQKYFQDHSGKNYFFYQQGFHQECLNIFIYDGKNLIGYGCASPPDSEGNSVYIIRKTLCHRYYGLTEYLDMLIYDLVLQKGGKNIDLGRNGSKGLSHYKLKFPGAASYVYYDGRLE